MTNPPPDCGHFVALRHPGHRYELPDSNSLSASKGDSVSAGSPVFVFARFSAELRGDPTTLSHGRWTETDLCAQIGDRVSGGQFATVVFSIANAAWLPSPERVPRRGFVVKSTSSSRKAERFSSGQTCLLAEIALLAETGDRFTVGQFASVVPASLQPCGRSVLVDESIFSMGGFRQRSPKCPMIQMLCHDWPLRKSLCCSTAAASANIPMGATSRPSMTKAMSGADRVRFLSTV